MGDLLSFKKPSKKTEKIPEETSIKEVHIDIKEIDEESKRQLKDYLLDANVLVDMQIHLHELKGGISAKNVELRKTLLRRNSLQEIKEFLTIGNPADWSLRPAYYQALLEVFNEKNKQ